MGWLTRSKATGQSKRKWVVIDVRTGTMAAGKVYMIIIYIIYDKRHHQVSQNRPTFDD